LAFQRAGFPEQRAAEFVEAVFVQGVLDTGSSEEDD